MNSGASRNYGPLHVMINYNIWKCTGDKTIQALFRKEGCLAQHLKDVVGENICTYMLFFMYCPALHCLPWVID